MNIFRAGTPKDLYVGSCRSTRRSFGVPQDDTGLKRIILQERLNVMRGDETFRRRIGNWKATPVEQSFPQRRGSQTRVAGLNFVSLAGPCSEDECFTPHLDHQPVFIHQITVALPGRLGPDLLGARPRMNAPLGGDINDQLVGIKYASHCCLRLCVYTIPTPGQPIMFSAGKACLVRERHRNKSFYRKLTSGFNTFFPEVPDNKVGTLPGVSTHLPKQKTEQAI
jgi:hypothetical protein